MSIFPSVILTQTIIVIGSDSKEKLLGQRVHYPVILIKFAKLLSFLVSYSWSVRGERAI